jgi:hypothetical protein
MCQCDWQDQYDLTRCSIPENFWSLLVVLEVIEKCQDKHGPMKPPVNRKASKSRKKSGKK